jgi:Holliday junction resolvase RusA-like endonuclease
MTALEVTLDDLPPSLNNLYATIEVKGRSRRILSSAANDWKRQAAWTMFAAAREQGWAVEAKVPLSVEVIYTAPDVLRWDLDGKIKLLLDAFSFAFGVDDRYVMSLRQSKARGPLRQLRMRVWIDRPALDAAVEQKR